MNSLPQVYVGVDVSKTTLDVYLHPLKISFNVENSQAGFEKLHERLTSNDTKSITCEATGGYESLFVTFFAGLNYKVHRINPRRIKNFVMCEGINAKTDKIDAKTIALYAANKVIPIEQMPPSKEHDQLIGLTRRRTQFVKMIADEKKRYKHPQDVDNRDSIRATMNFLEGEIAKVAAKIDDLINANEQWRKKSQLIQTMPGVGKLTANLLIACLPELGSIDNKRIASLSGVAPFTKQSGAQKGFSKIFAGRLSVRNALFMCAMTAVRHNPILKEFYERLIKAGKRKLVALVAVMRKIVITLNAMLRKEEAWINKAAA
jgi:transposase